MHRLYEIRSKEQARKDFVRMRALHHNLNQLRVMRKKQTLNRRRTDFGNTINTCAIKSFCHATGEKPGRVLNHLLKNENLAKRYRKGDFNFRRDESTHPRVIAKLGKKFGWKFKHVLSHDIGDIYSTPLTARKILKGLHPNKKYIAVTKFDYDIPHTFNMDKTNGIKDYTYDHVSPNHRPNAHSYLVYHLFEVQKDLKHPRWNWKPRKMNEARTRDQILKSIQRQRDINKNLEFLNRIRTQGGATRSVEGGNPSFGNSINTCALQAFCDTTGEHPHRVMKYLTRTENLRDEHHPSSLFYRRDHPTHPRAIAKLAKKFGYRFKKIPVNSLAPGKKYIAVSGRGAGTHSFPIDDKTGAPAFHRHIHTVFEVQKDPNHPRWNWKPRKGKMNEARSKDEILRAIEREAILHRNLGRFKNLGEKGVNLHRKNVCAINTFCHATGEKPKRVMNYLLKQENLSRPRLHASYSFTRGMPTHPRVIAKMAKKFGYKLTKLPRAMHGEEWSEGSWKPHRAEEVSRHLKKSGHFGPHFGVTYNDGTDEYAHREGDNEIIHADYGLPIGGVAHVFNIDHVGSQDYTHPADNPKYYQVSHLIKIEKDPNHPRWNWQKRKDK